MTKVNRAEVYSAVDSERNYQDHHWPQDGFSPDDEEPNQLTVGEFVLLLDEYASKARAVWTTEKKPEGLTLDVVRKIAGIAVNCMEQHGAPRREGF